MLFPSIDNLLKKADSKYSLVIAVSRRARRLKDGADMLIERPKSHKLVGTALEEIDAEKIIMVNK